MTTHETATEFDYFSAVDDLNTHGDTGAGHIGTGEFTSGVYYRYATVDLDDLIANAGSADDAGLLTTQFLHSFVKSLPSGKSNATAPHTLPGLVVLTVRDDKPVSYASAYENPVRTSGNGHMIPSVERIAEHAKLVAKVYGNTPAWSGYVNAATTNTDTVAALAEAFGQEVDGGLDDLIASAVRQAGLAIPPEFTTAPDKTGETPA
jgi:CRISPR system Cascade subunit CasC